MFYFGTETSRSRRTVFVMLPGAIAAFSRESWAIPPSDSVAFGGRRPNPVFILAGGVPTFMSSVRWLSGGHVSTQPGVFIRPLRAVLAVLSVVSGLNNLVLAACLRVESAYVYSESIGTCQYYYGTLRFQDERQMRGAASCLAFGMRHYLCCLRHEPLRDEHSLRFHVMGVMTFFDRGRGRSVAVGICCREWPSCLYRNSVGGSVYITIFPTFSLCAAWAAVVSS